MLRPSLRRRAILCRGQRSVQLRSRTDDPAPVSDRDASSERRVAFRQGPSVRGAQPQAQQVALALGLRPVHERRTVVEDRAGNLRGRFRGVRGDRDRLAVP